MGNRVDSKLLEKLEKKLKVQRRQVNYLIQAKVNELYVSRSAAAVALAASSNINVSRYVDELMELAHHKPQSASPIPAPTFAKQESRRSPARQKQPTKSSRTTVFVVHGRDEKLRQSMFNFLRAIGLIPMEWDTALAAAKKGTPYVGEVLDKALERAAAVVVLLSPDDEASLRKALQHRTEPAYEKKPTGQARPNVLFEAGMAMGRKPDKTVIVQVGKVRPFSDIGGRHVLKLSNTPQSRNSLVSRLRSAGCEIDSQGNDWLTEGDFTPTS